MSGEIDKHLGGGKKALVTVPQPRLGLLAEPRFLQATISVPPALVANAIAVQEANREYQERALARDGLRRMYIGTLTLSLFLAVFGAVLLAIILGNQLARPLLLLAEGVRQVARGDLGRKAVFASRDELGGLGGGPDRVRGDDGGPRLGEELLHLVGDPFDAGAAGDEAVLLAALGARTRRRHHMAAMMALEPADEPVLNHPRRAVGALEPVAAMPAERQRRLHRRGAHRPGHP